VLSILNDLTSVSPDLLLPNHYSYSAVTDLVNPSPKDSAFQMLPPNDGSPSGLDANPRFLRLENFASRFLTPKRDVVVYLPEAYLNEPDRHFPVFYLHDGQNLIDGRTSYLADHTWRIHTTADELTEAGLIEPIILVGIDNTGLRRMAEYTPTRDPRRGGGDGPLYGKLLVEELKPLIDKSFRTLADAANTALGGSSLGGLVTLDLALTYPDIFGKVAVMSPSIWWNNRSILDRAGSASPNPPLRIWLDIGTAEGLRHVRDTDLLHRRLIQRGWRDRSHPQPKRDGIDLHYLRVPGGLHNEDAWAARFDQVLRFLFPHR
jgi:predicted alpha/beta superfamily hydrolase